MEGCTQGKLLINNYFHLFQTCTFSATPVDLLPVSQLFPQTNVDSATMVHLWPKSSAGMSLTVMSWAGLFYTQDFRERTVYFETFLNFIEAFKSLNTYNLRILIGGLYNVDIKLAQFWRFNNLVPLCFKISPYPYERKELKCSFIYTKETLKVNS